METRRPVLSKIVVGSAGLGVADLELLERRAREVAIIEGRELPNENDRAEAYRELHGKRAETGEELVWIAGEEREDESGTAEERAAVAPRRMQIYMDGDENTGEELIREGIEEAEHERMLLAHFMDAETEE